MTFHLYGECMVTYDIIDRWVFEQSSVPENESRKEVQIVRNQNQNGIYVRTAYYGPSGRYGQNAPTFDISEDNQQQLMSALSEAFPKAREIRRKEEWNSKNRENLGYV